MLREVAASVRESEAELETRARKSYAARLVGESKRAGSKSVCVAAGRLWSARYTSAVTGAVLIRPATSLGLLGFLWSQERDNSGKKRFVPSQQCCSNRGSLRCSECRVRATLSTCKSSAEENRQSDQQRKP